MESAESSRSSGDGKENDVEDEATIAADHITLDSQESETEQENVEASEENTSALLEEPVASSSIAEVSSAPQSMRIEDSHGIEIVPEDLEEAGLRAEDLDNISEAQARILIEIAERRLQSSGAVQYEPDNNPPITVVITPDGALKLTDLSNRSVVFMPDQLRRMNVDINNLAEESLQQIIHQAMASLNTTKESDTSPEQTEEFATSYVTHQPRQSLRKSSEEGHGYIHANDLIGSEVSIHRNGKSQLATVRYVRSNGTYKVQFPDGHFEWVSGSQVTWRQQSRISHSSGFPNILKRSAPTIISSTATKKPALEANFCCPICEQKVHQKEPSFIVVRIPACDSCSKEKMVILDENQT